MRYREARAEDADPIAQLHADSWRRTYRGAFSHSFLEGPAVLTDRRAIWTERLTQRDPSSYTVVADEHGAVVGFAHTRFDDDPVWGALVDNLHVVEHLKRCGIGRRLMAESAGAVVARRAQSGMFLWVLQQNTAAQAFYESIGGSRAGEGVSAPPGGGSVPTFRYAWTEPARLSPPANGVPPRQTPHQNVF